MFGVAAAWGQLERLLGAVAGVVVGAVGAIGARERTAMERTASLALTNESLSKYASGEYGGHVAPSNNAARAPVSNHTRAESDMSISPHESWSSHSSGELSGMPSPTGVVRCDDRGLCVGKELNVKTISAYDSGLDQAYLLAMGAGTEQHRQDDTIYLFKYDVAGVAGAREGACDDGKDDAEMFDRNRAMHANTPSKGCLFVHKKLSPIKTRVVDPRVTAPYRPLLRTLIQQSKGKDGVKRDHRHIPAVRSVAKGEGEGRMEGMRMLPTGLTMATTS